MQALPIFDSDGNGDIIITIPSTTDLETYKKEISKAEDGNEVMNYKVSNFPTKTKIGDKCYICYDNQIIGWMTISNFSTKQFKCTTTGKHMAGNFIERTGKFHWLNIPINYKGFRGFRYAAGIII